MRDYQPGKAQYSLPREAYMSTVWLIRDYKRHKMILEDKIGLSAVAGDGMSLGSGPSGPTFRRAADIYDSYSYKVVAAVDEAIRYVPEDMRQGVLDSVTKRRPYPDVPSTRTWGREKAKFVYLVHYLMARDPKDGNTGQ